MNGCRKLFQKDFEIYATVLLNNDNEMKERFAKRGKKCKTFLIELAR